MRACINSHGVWSPPRRSASGEQWPVAHCAQVCGGTHTHALLWGQSVQETLVGHTSASEAVEVWDPTAAGQRSEIFHSSQRLTSHREDGPSR